jgi:hypothetical protein
MSLTRVLLAWFTVSAVASPFIGTMLAANSRMTRPVPVADRRTTAVATRYQD